MKKLSNLFSEILEIPKSKLNRLSSPQNITTWDSVNNLILISEIEKEYNCLITIEDVYRLKNMGDVFDLIKKVNTKIKF